MSDRYALYYTLIQNLPKKKMLESEKVKLIQKAENLTTEEKEAIIMLIYEHAKNLKDFQEKDLPYEGKQKGKNVEIDLKMLPSDLCWVISRFLNVVSKE